MPGLVFIGVSTRHAAPVKGHVGFNADDGFDAHALTVAEKFNHPMHNAVVGESQGRLAQTSRLGSQVSGASQAVKQRIFTMDVKVDKV
jgi:hypothetical protein